MKRIIAYLCLFAAAFLAGYMLTSCAMDDKPKAQVVSMLNLAKDRVVQIVVYAHDTGWSGTGWIVKSTLPNTFVVTNKHVCGNERTVYVKPEKEFVLYRAIVLRTSQFADLCLIEVSPEMPAPAGGYTLANTDPLKGEAVFVFGYGYGGPLLPVPGKFLGKLISDYKEWDQVGRTFGAIDTEIYHGHSGSPVLNAEGNVIGVANSVFANPNALGQKLSYFVTLDQLERFLTMREGPIK